ncbi:MAG: hypothetical protein SFZ02_20650 [bacterium]|nr:hypothetical protein [bacterium]
MLRAIGLFIWRFMVIFSFIVNIVLVVVLLVAGLFIFHIKAQVAQPLVAGLHSSFVGLDNATIDWVIPVRDTITLNTVIPLNTCTTVTLNDSVPLVVNANIVLPGVGNLNNAQVNLSLPNGLPLPICLNIEVPVTNLEVPVSLDVRAVIPLRETQLHDVAQNLRLLFEPLAVGLTNLPDDFGEAVTLVGDVFAGRANLLKENEYTLQPWPGYSMTAGYGYDLITVPSPEESRPLQTGIVPLGGIPFLDDDIRPELYANGNTPYQINLNAMANLNAQNVDPRYYNGGVGEIIATVNGGVFVPQTTDNTNTTNPPTTDEGIITNPPPIDPNATPFVSPDLPIGGPVATPTPNPDQGILPPAGG